MRTTQNNYKACGTCSNWCGRQEPDVINKKTTYDPDEQARCSADIAKPMKKGSTTACSKWVQRFR